MNAFTAYGRQALQAGLFDAAIAAFSQAPADARARAGLGVAWARKGSYATALKHLQASVQLQPAQIDVWCVIGELALDELDFKIAAHALQRCLELDPQATHAAGLRARALVKKGLKKLKAAT